MAFERAEHAEGLLRTMLPADAVALLDFATLEHVPSSFHDAELRDTEADLLFRVELADEEAFVYVLLEHQSSVDATMPWRLLRYMVRIWESWSRSHPAAKKLPAIVPLVVAHGASSWNAPTRFTDSFAIDEAARATLAPWLVDFRYVVVDLTARDPRWLRETQTLTVMGSVTLFALLRTRYATDLLAELRTWSSELRTLEQTGGEDLGTIIVYTWLVARVSPAAWRRFLRDELHTEPERIMTNAEKLMAQFGPLIVRESRADGLAQGLAEGRAQGLAEGLAEGRVEGLAEGRVEGLAEGRVEGLAEGRAAVLLRQLARRFGPVSAEVEARVRGATCEQLDVMAERIFDAADPMDVVG